MSVIIIDYYDSFEKFQSDDIKLSNDKNNDQLMNAMYNIHLYQKQLYSLLVPIDEVIIDYEIDDYIFDDNGIPLSRDRELNDILSDVKKNAQILAESNNKLFTLDCNISMNKDTIESYNDVKSIDESFFSRNHRHHKYKKYIVVVRDDNNNYVGHVWAYTHEDYDEYIGIYGIQSSICNKKMKNIASMLIEKLKDIKHNGTIVVPEPLFIMRKILKKMGFIEYTTEYMTPERNFLKGIFGGINYFTLKY